MAKARRRQQANELPPDVVERIRADVARWRPRLWQEEHPITPTCTCGLNKKASRAMHFNWDGLCRVHGPVDRAITAAVKLMDYLCRDLVCDCGECEECAEDGRPD